MNKHSLNQITPRIHWLSPDSATDRPVLGAIVGSRATLLVDAGNSPAHARALLGALELVDGARPAFVALTHWHWDHVFGAATLDLPTLAHHETRRIVGAMARQDWSDAALDRRVAAGEEIAFCRDMIKAELPDRRDLVIRPPDLSFADAVELDLGGLTCQIIHVGGDHAADSSIVYVPEERVVFMGDCYYTDIYHHTRRYTTARLFPLLDRLLACAADFYLPSHHAAPLTRAELVAEAEQLRTIGQIVDAHGPDRDAVLAALAQHRSAPLSEDDLDIAAEFIAGLE